MGKASCLIHPAILQHGSSNVSSCKLSLFLPPTLTPSCRRWLDYSKALALGGSSSCIQAARLGIDGEMLCADDALHQQAPSLSFLYYIVSKGLLLVASGPAAAIIISVVCMKHGGSRAAGSATPRKGINASKHDGNDEEEEEEVLWPLATFGIHILPGMHPHFALLEAWIHQRLRLINSTVAVALICGPAAGFFILRAFLARFDASVGHGLMGAVLWVLTGELLVTYGFFTGRYERRWAEKIPTALSDMHAHHSCLSLTQFMCGVCAEEWLVSMLASLLLGRLVFGSYDTVWLFDSQEDPLELSCCDTVCIPCHRQGALHHGRHPLGSGNNL